MSARNGSIEVLRIWSALGIVCFHAQTGLLSVIGYAGLPAFAILSFYLLGDVRSASGPQSQPLDQFIQRRAGRLLLPWAAWMALYLAFDLALSVSGLRPRDDVFSSFNPFFGTRIHLWYLPFVFIGLVAIRVLAPAIGQLGRWPLTLAMGTAALITTLWLPALPWLAHLPEPGPQFLFATPAIFYGVALAQLGREPNARRRSTAALSLGAVGLAGAVGQHWLFGNSWIPFGLAVPATCVAVLLPSKEGATSRLLAPLTLGIYLLHPLVVGVVNRAALLPRLGLPDELTFVVGFVVSAVVIYGLQKTPLKFAI